MRYGVELLQAESHVTYNDAFSLWFMVLCLLRLGSVLLLNAVIVQ